MDSDPLGIFSSLVIKRKEVQVSSGDRFYLYTDGFIESSPGGGREDGLIAWSPCASCTARIRSRNRQRGSPPTYRSKRPAFWTIFCCWPWK